MEKTVEINVSRVAGAFFADFHIPGDLTFLWRYMKLMYSLDAFIQSVPADQVSSSLARNLNQSCTVY